jgi:hypothetical protein
MEHAADQIVRRLYQSLTMPDAAKPACALVRLFVTVPYEQLPADQQEFARRLLPDIANTPGMKCLTLLATAGEQSDWNSRKTSMGHQALPLPSEERIARSPMISQLIRQLGVDVGTLLSPGGGVMIDEGQHTFNVFHVPDARGSQYIPAQREFVEPFQIQSVLGFGGLLPPGELFATILFSRAPISREVAERFRTLALNVKVALLPFASDRIFQ